MDSVNVQVFGDGIFPKCLETAIRRRHSPQWSGGVIPNLHALDHPLR